MVLIVKYCNTLQYYCNIILFDLPLTINAFGYRVSRIGTSTGTRVVFAETINHFGSRFNAIVN